MTHYYRIWHIPSSVFCIVFALFRKWRIQFLRTCRRHPICSFENRVSCGTPPRFRAILPFILQYCARIHDIYTMSIDLIFFSRCPPKPKRMADSSLSWKSALPRDMNRS